MSVNPIRANDAAVPGASPQVAKAIQMASLRSGVDFSYLVTKAAMESGFDPGIAAKTSSASGLYQFIDETWLEMIAAHGAKYGLGDYAEALRSGNADKALKQQILDLRGDPKISALMAAEYTRSNREHLEQTVGGRIGNTELYLAHFLGPGGAEKFLRALQLDPSQSAADLLPAAAKANRGVFYEKNGRPRSLSEVYDRFAARFADHAFAMAKATDVRGGIAGSNPAEVGTRPATSDGAGPSPTRSPYGVPATLPDVRMHYTTRLYLLSLSMPDLGRDKDRA
jgi:hypothetical protein